MPAYKDETRNNWYCAFYFEDWNGERKKKMKRGFETKKAAQDWERQFLLQRAADTDMRFDKFVEQYIADRKDRLRENTWLTKEHIINTKILPYFKDRKLREIQARDVIAWQNELMSAKDDRGKLRFMLYKDSMNTDKLIDFMTRLITDSKKKVFLILDNLRVHHAKKVTAWLAEHKSLFKPFCKEGLRTVIE